MSLCCDVTCHILFCKQEVYSLSLHGPNNFHVVLLIYCYLIVLDGVYINNTILGLLFHYAVVPGHLTHGNDKLHVCQFHSDLDHAFIWESHSIDDF